jgi:hypothetical protein
VLQFTKLSSTLLIWKYFHMPLRFLPPAAAMIVDNEFYYLILLKGCCHGFMLGLGDIRYSVISRDR